MSGPLTVAMIAFVALWQENLENSWPKTSQLTDCRKCQMTIVTSACKWIVNVMYNMLRPHNLYCSCKWEMKLIEFLVFSLFKPGWYMPRKAWVQVNHLHTMAGLTQNSTEWDWLIIKTVCAATFNPPVTSSITVLLWSLHAESPTPPTKT